MRRPIVNNSNPGDCVYEPFCGSGTTIIATEMTGRACRAIELSPAYVDVAVRRWQAFTGKTAMLEASGQSFDDVAADRGVVCTSESNCDVHDGWPPPQVLPLMEHARNGTLASIFQPMVDRPDLARARHARGESVPLFRGYAEPSVLTDEIIGLYLRPLLSSQQRVEAFQRYWLGFDNAQTVAVHAALKTLEVPTLIVWGLKDYFFDKKWAYWLKDTIPGARRVVEVEDARLFFPEDRPGSFATPMLEFWAELSRT